MEGQRGLCSLTQPLPLFLSLGPRQYLASTSHMGHLISSSLLGGTLVAKENFLTTTVFQL